MVVRNSSGPKTKPTSRVAKRISVTPSSPDCPIVAIVASTEPIRLQVLPPFVVPMTYEQVLFVCGAESGDVVVIQRALPSTQPRSDDSHVMELDLNPFGTGDAEAGLSFDGVPAAMSGRLLAWAPAAVVAAPVKATAATSTANPAPRVMRPIDRVMTLSLSCLSDFLTELHVPADLCRQRQLSH